MKALCSQWDKDGVDLVLDPVGKSHALANADVLALDGRWVVFGLLSGGKVDGFPLDLVMRKRLSITGTTLRNRSPEYKAALVQAFVGDCYEPLKRGDVKMVIDQTFQMEQIQEAHAHMEADQTMGKVVVTVPQ